MHDADQLGELAQVLRDGRERAFVARTGETAQAQATEVEIGATLNDLARSYNVSMATISRLRA